MSDGGCGLGRCGVLRRQGLASVFGGRGFGGGSEVRGQRVGSGRPCGMAAREGVGTGSKRGVWPCRGPPSLRTVSLARQHPPLPHGLSPGVTQRLRHCGEGLSCAQLARRFEVPCGAARGFWVFAAAQKGTCCCACVRRPCGLCSEPNHTPLCRAAYPQRLAKASPLRGQVRRQGAARPGLRIGGDCWFAQGRFCRYSSSPLIPSQV